MSQIEKIARIIEPEAWKWHDRRMYADLYESDREASLQKARNILSAMDIEDGLAVVNKLIQAGQLTVVVETPEGSNCCPVASANLNGNNIDVWLDEKFGNEIQSPDDELEWP